MSNIKCLTYILSGHEPVIEPDLLKWAKWLETANRIVDCSLIESGSVSTVFLGLDHSRGEGPPLLFETMVFGDVMHGFSRRYSNWTDAVKGHQHILQLVRGDME